MPKYHREWLPGAETSRMRLIWGREVAGAGRTENSKFTIFLQRVWRLEGSFYFEPEWVLLSVTICQRGREVAGRETKWFFILFSILIFNGDLQEILTCSGHVMLGHVACPRTIGSHLYPTHLPCNCISLPKHCMFCALKMHPWFTCYTCVQCVLFVFYVHMCCSPFDASSDNHLNLNRYLMLTL